MLDKNKLYVIETDGSIHEMNYIGDADWSEKATTSLQEIRNRIIDEFAEQLYSLCGVEIGDYQYQNLLHEGRIDEIAEKMKRV